MHAFRLALTLSLALLALGALPAVASAERDTDPATSIGSTTAMLNGTVEAGDTYRFEYIHDECFFPGPPCPTWQFTSFIQATASGNVSRGIGGLEPGEPYVFRLRIGDQLYGSSGPLDSRGFGPTDSFTTKQRTCPGGVCP